MNLLAHLHLGTSLSPSAAAGNLTADFCKEIGSDEFRRGVHFHRHIDSFTDTHAAVSEARAIFPGGFRRFGGVLSDLAFDLCLSQTWDDWTGDANLADFVDRQLFAIVKRAKAIPPNSAEVLSRMAKERWLLQYQDLEGLRTTIARIVWRRPVAAKMFGADLIIEKHYDDFADIFRVFYPQLVAFARELSVQLTEARPCVLVTRKINSNL